jgi:pimeloyl-ACP methyl ester carboxylesterase
VRGAGCSGWRTRRREPATSGGARGAGGGAAGAAARRGRPARGGGVHRCVGGCGGAARAARGAAGVAESPLTEFGKSYSAGLPGDRYVWTRGRRFRGGVKRGLIGIGGFGSTAPTAVAGQGKQERLRAGIPELGADLTNGELWGNDQCIGLIDDLFAFGVSHCGFKSDKFILLGASHGTTCALNYAHAHPDKVAAIALSLPAVNPQDIHDNARGTPYGATPAQMESVYGGSRDRRDRCAVGCRLPGAAQLILRAQARDATPSSRQRRARERRRPLAGGARRADQPDPAARRAADPAAPRARRAEGTEDDTASSPSRPGRPVPPKRRRRRRELADGRPT